jgi:hypothetical protein
MCEPGATDVELADFILQHYAHVPLEGREARNLALQMLSDAVRLKRAEVHEHLRVLEQSRSGRS